MDIEKLIRRLRNDADAYRNGKTLGRAFADQEDVLDNAATALSTLQAENEEMQKHLNEFSEFLCHMTGGLLSKTNYTAQEMISAAEDYEQKVCGECDLRAENEKLRAELESKEKYYEQMIDALSATDSADLAQMTACVYYKPGGLCRYDGNDPANVCVLGPCPHERTAEEVLADLARVTAERDAAVKVVERVRSCKDCGHYTGEWTPPCKECQNSEEHHPYFKWCGQKED